MARESLSDGRRRFCEEYVKLGGGHGNAVRAARLAGYAESCAHAEASRMLKNKQVRAYIGELCDDMAKDGGLVGLNVMRQFAEGTDLFGVRVPHEIQYKAAVRLAELAGFQVIAKSEQRITVADDRTPEERQARIKELMSELSPPGTVIDVVPIEIPDELPLPGPTEMEKELDKLLGGVL